MKLKTFIVSTALHFSLIFTLAVVIKMSLLCVLGISNGYIKSDHEDALYGTPENVGNSADEASVSVIL